MESRGRHIAFDASHPSVPLAFICGMLSLTMFGLHPHLVAISLGCALMCSLSMRGWQATLRSLAWAAPTALLVAVLNPIISRSGATLLIRIGTLGVRLEAVVFGACMGGMLAAMVLWVACAAAMLPGDRLLAVAGRVFPTVALMVSMTARLVPQLISRAGEMRAASQASSVAVRASVPNRIASTARTSGALVAWALSSSLDSADAMRARGWVSGMRRTSYQLYRFTRCDALSLALVIAGALASALFSWQMVSGFSFYPLLVGPSPWPGALVLVAYGLAPSILTLIERMSWGDLT